MPNNDEKITVFYDGHCPLCDWEINHLKKKDSENNIEFEDIKSESFSTKYPNLNKQQLDALLHVQQSDGQWQTGLDATYLLWNTVGAGKWFSPLKWRWLRPILKPCYLVFAKYRHNITSVLFPKRAAHLVNKTKQETHHE
jgi:predicted DCC family thiol-disulfide oxidoreductase YuxK